MGIFFLTVCPSSCSKHGEIHNDTELMEATQQSRDAALYFILIRAGYNARASSN